MTAPRFCFVSLAVLGILCSQPLAAQPLSTPSLFAEVARAQSNPKEFGPLRLGMSEAEVTEKLGTPDQISRRGMMTESEESAYTWDYAGLGVTLYFSATDETSPGTVLAIRAKPPCGWTGLDGLKIGMSIDSASKILGKGRGGNVTPIGSVGTEYAGLYFQLLETAVVARLEMGAVSVIYVGPNLP